MSSRRTERVASVVREVVSLAILHELRDPRIRNVTVLGAEVSGDLRHAKVRISVMGDEKAESLTLHGLNSARGYLQAKVAERIKSRYTPELRFVVDDGLQKAAEADRILRELEEERRLNPVVLTDGEASDGAAADADDLPGIQEDGELDQPNENQPESGMI